MNHAYKYNALYSRLEKELCIFNGVQVCLHAYLLLSGLSKQPKPQFSSGV